MITPPTFWNLDSVLVMDIETDGLRDWTTIHCVVATDYHTGVVYEFTQPTSNRDEEARLRELLSSYETVAGHFFLTYDQPVLNHFFPGILPRSKVLDTLVLSRLFNANLPGGHSIEAWGERVGKKKKHAGYTDWHVFTKEMLERCHSDVEVNKAVLKRFWRYVTDKDWHYSIWLEHFVQGMCNDMSKEGLPFDTEGAIALRKELQDRIDPIDESLKEDFPPRPVLIREIIPRRTKMGTFNAQDFRWARNWEYATFDKGDHYEVHLIRPTTEDRLDISWCDGRPIHLYELEEFNPGSVRQIVQRMNEAGWKPTDKTKGHIDALKERPQDPERIRKFQEFGWKVSEENLKTLPDTAPQSAKNLAQRLVLQSRISDVDEWLALVTDEGKIHGNYNGIGAWTHRVSHNNPNTANIPVGHPEDWMSDWEKYVASVSYRMRGLFVAPKGWRMQGTDADGIQMRIFAHYVQDERLIESLISGKKENGTDIHTLHKTALGDVCKSRDAAKTFIYAFLLGAGVAKVAEILECSVKEAKEAVDNFLAFYPGLKELKQSVIPRDAKRGYFVGLDGRKVVQNSEHLMLSGYLQNGEKIIMAGAAYLWMKKFKEEGIDYRLVNWVHDEWQTLFPDDDSIVIPASEMQVQAIRDMTEVLGMRCPLEGTTTIKDGFYGGYSWAETH